MDLLGLGLQDYNPSLFDWLPSSIAAETTTAVAATHRPIPSPAPESSEVLNTPASPNSSYISSSSNEAPLNNSSMDEPQTSGKAENDREPDDEDNAQDQDKSKKQ